MQLQNPTSRLPPRATCATEPHHLQAQLQSSPVTEGAVIRHWTFTEKKMMEEAGEFQENNVFWWTAFGTVTQVQFVFRAFPPHFCPHNSLPGLPSFFFVAHKGAYPPSHQLNLFVCHPQSSRLNQSVKILVNVPAIFQVACHFNRVFLELKLRTREITTSKHFRPHEA